ncbi:MAG: hypothetical protein HY331_19060 [Chloroflexi bacterium]|nr:hypothetical protein [Chloroflexota bacterium]
MSQTYLGAASQIGTARDNSTRRSIDRSSALVGDGSTGFIDVFIAVFVAVLALNLAAAWAALSWLGAVAIEPMVRTVDAWRVLAGGDLGLVRLAFTWPPLPLVLELPLSLIPPMRASGFSGQVLTALLGAWACVGVLRALAALGVGRRMRLGMVAAVALNPLVLFAGATGAAEVVAMAATVWSVASLVSWAVTRHLRDFAVSSFSLALAVLADDTGVIQAAVMAVMVQFLLEERPIRPGARSALTLAYVTPAVAALLFWVFLRLFVMGGPLPPEAGALAAAEATFQSSRATGDTLGGGLSGALTYLAHTTTVLFPAFGLGVLATLPLAWRRRSRLGFGLAWLALVLPVFQAVHILTGWSGPSLRSALLMIPLGAILIGYVLASSFGLGAQAAPTPSLRRRLDRSLVSLAALALLLGSGVSTFDTVRQSAEWQPWIERLAQGDRSGDWEPAWTTERRIAAYLAERGPGRGVLIDGVEGYPVLFFSGHPDWFVTAGDPGFAQAVRLPVGSVDFVLLPAPRATTAGNRISRAHPSLFAAGAAWATLEQEWPSEDATGRPWRLYSVHASGGDSR